MAHFPLIRPRPGLPAAGSESRGRHRYPFPAAGSERRGRFTARSQCPSRHLRALGRGPSRSHPAFSWLPSPCSSAPGPWTTRTPVSFEALRPGRHRRAGARANGGVCACAPHSSSRWSPAFSAPSTPFVLSSSARCSRGGLRGVSRRRLRSLRGCSRRRRESQPVAHRHGGATASWARRVQTRPRRLRLHWRRGHRTWRVACCSCVGTLR